MDGRNNERELKTNQWVRPGPSPDVIFCLLLGGLQPHGGIWRARGDVVGRVFARARTGRASVRRALRALDAHALRCGARARRVGVRIASASVKLLRALLEEQHRGKPALPRPCALGWRPPAYSGVRVATRVRLELELHALATQAAGVGPNAYLAPAPSSSSL